MGGNFAFFCSANTDNFATKIQYKDKDIKMLIDDIGWGTPAWQALNNFR